MRPRSDADLVAGVVFIGFGLAFGVAASRYDVGSLLRMGPGYFPLVVSSLLVVLGVVIAVKAYVAPDLAHLEDLDTPDEEKEGLSFGRVRWQPSVLLVGAAVFFALTVDGLGLLPATFGTGVIAAFARPGARPLRVLTIAAGLTLACYVIFVVLLQLRLSLLGDWLGG
ncbi:tripartite tricarboxylate transporter TctB family protein [Nocardioides sp.]|nr:tripartite tricarboxylate transporter TctB family protein [Nocardioides sp.]